VAHSVDAVTGFNRKAHDARIHAEGRDERRAARQVRERMHYRRDGMVTVCGVRLDTETERRARFPDDIGTLRRARVVCETCAKGGG
jgi:hypothetical protein